MREMTFIAACRSFFGPKDGQSLLEFAKEVKELTPKDRADMVEMFKAVDIDATKSS